MNQDKNGAAVWARARAADIRAHSINQTEASKIMLMLADDRRAEAENLTEKAETDLLRAKTAREGSFGQVADELEIYARSLDDRAKGLLHQAAALEALAMKPA